MAKSRKEVHQKLAFFTLKNARKLRKEIGLDKTELAALAGISSDSIRKIEKGDPVKEETTYKLRNALVAKYSMLGKVFDDEYAKIEELK